MRNSQLVIVLLGVVVAACGKADDPAVESAASSNQAAPNTPAPSVDAVIPPVTLVGTDGDDVLEGAGGHDHLTGGLGADRIDGKDGFDYARYDDAKAAVIVSLMDPSTNTGEAKGDVFVSVQGLVGSAFDDELFGDDQTNDLHGQAGNDRLYGNGGADGLNGEDGDDRLDGGPGIDTYVGGSGADTFIFRAGEADGDTINDFEEESDRIVFVNYGSGATFTKRERGRLVVQSKDGLVMETINLLNDSDVKPSQVVFE